MWSNTSISLTLLTLQFPTEQHHQLHNSIWSHFLPVFWCRPVRWDPAEPWVMMALQAANSFIHHLVILLMHDDLLSRPPLCPGLPLHQESMINGVPSKLHQLAKTIWYLSLQDCIYFWEIMQKMNCHVRELSERRAAIPALRNKPQPGNRYHRGHTHTRAHTHTTTQIHLKQRNLVLLKSVSPFFRVQNVWTCALCSGNG